MTGAYDGESRKQCCLLFLVFAFLNLCNDKTYLVCIGLLCFLNVYMSVFIHISGG